MHRIAFAILLIIAVAAPETAAQSTGNAVNGERLFLRCKACHTLTAGGRSRLGPTLEGLFGRRVGSLEGYQYSRALKDADFIWDQNALETWLANPSSFLPGNRMAFAGFRLKEDRKDLIAYLEAATIPPAQTR